MHAHVSVTSCRGRYWRSGCPALPGTQEMKHRQRDWICRQRADLFISAANGISGRRNTLFPRGVGIVKESGQLAMVMRVLSFVATPSSSNGRLPSMPGNKPLSTTLRRGESTVSPMRPQNIDFFFCTDSDEVMSQAGSKTRRSPLLSRMMDPLTVRFFQRREDRWPALGRFVPIGQNRSC